MNDLGKAFSFPFKDRDWPTKFLIGGLMVILCIFIVGIFLLAGYFVQTCQRVMRREENPLPDWSDNGVKFVLGFKLCLVYLIYALPIVIIYVPFVVLMVLSSVSNPESVMPALAGLSFVGVIFVFVIPYGLALTAFSPVIFYQFALRERMSDALDIVEVFRAFKRNWQNVVVVALITVGVHSFAGIGVIALLIGFVFTVFYAYLISSYMYGLLGRDAVQPAIGSSQTGIVV